ncbi:hypothetical protein K469DRAFT_667496 [Zopfia rhizophila CBS 207.26]|uniref:Conserved oligomeric Golgi complex subunit 1 n=1 Tax=Zopfia rhizophila CBS 207.26 TaxID=1314779 RepID=A0A6A6E0W9_9PEZI|nr:hypothetical protein K469DRAFT_667496 [Zopfia rhizophila CBS 207.26]
MTTEAPDPRTFKSWEDAFQYPVPVVRKLESQLRSSAGDNREKLRSLVGASYRSLLDTAETIIDMEGRMQQVETKMARVGQKCNSRGVDRISNNATRMDNHIRARDIERYTFASQLSVLRNCPVVIGRLLKRGGSHLLAAKVLVISRLLHKALSQSKNKPPFLDQIRDRLSALRRKLLSRIDKQLASTVEEAPVLVQSMCAYSLATSSTPTDVLRHFYHVRMEEIVSSLQHGEDLAKHGMDALKLCLQTCQDTQAIFPRRLAESLTKLKAQPLIQDPDVRALYELNLDIHDRWIGDEARNYTPWPRHDELQRPEAEKMLNQWSKQAISAFLKGIKTVLSKTDDLKEVASLRQELIETWILSGARMPGLKSANVLDDLRDAMNAQLMTIVRFRAQGLQYVVSDLTRTLETLPSNGDAPSISLWNTSSMPMGIGDGAQAFKSRILNTHQGRDEAVVRVVSTYDKWAESVLEVKGIIKAMKETRWDDTFADDADDSDDEFSLDSKQTLLSDDDPRSLEEVTQEALSDALRSLQKSMAQIVAQSTSSQDKPSIPQSIFILRAVREIGDRVPRLRVQDKSAPLSTPFTSEFLKPLHDALATYTIRSAADAYKKALTTAGKSCSRSHILWEGNPPLPVQPSPSAFRFLQHLVKNMGTHGSDLWAPNAVNVMKALASEEVSKIWREALDMLQKGADQVTQNKDLPDTPESQKQDESSNLDQSASGNESRREKPKQLLFDILYIQRYLGTSNSPAPIEALVNAVHEACGIDDGMLGRLKKNASDYGRKTYLLFALLS